MSHQSALARSTAVRPAPRPSARTRPAPPRLQLVAPVSGHSRTRLALVCVTLLVGGLLALLWLNISLSKGAYELDAAQAQHDVLVEQVQKLQTEVQLDRAPTNLAAKADQLGMVPAPNTAFIDAKGNVIGSAAAAKAAPRTASVDDAAAARDAQAKAAQAAKDAEAKAAKDAQAKAAKAAQDKAAQAAADKAAQTSAKTATKTGTKTATKTTADPAKGETKATAATTGTR